MPSHQVTNPPFSFSTTTGSSTPSSKPEPTLDTLPLETRLPIIQYTHPEHSAEQLTAWLLLNRKLHNETKDYMKPFEAEFVDRTVCKRMREYYEAQQDPERTSPLPANHYQDLLAKAKVFFAKKRYVRLGLAYSEPAEGSTGIPAPSYWPSGRIDLNNIPDLLRQLDGNTDLQSLEVGLAVDHIQSTPPFWEFSYSEPYEKQPGRYFDKSKPSLEKDIKEIVAELVKIKSKNPQCEISLSFSCSYIEQDPMAVDAPPPPADIRRTLVNHLLDALKENPGITTLNILTFNKDLVSRVASIATQDGQKIQTLRFHLFDVSPKTGEGLKLAMANAKTPLSLECHMHPEWDSQWLPYEGSKRHLKLPIEGKTKAMILLVRSMMNTFAASDNAQSLRLIGPPVLAQVVLSALKRNVEFAELQFDAEVNEASRDAAKRLLESGLEELKREKNPQVRCTVKYRRFQGTKRPESTAYGTPLSLPTEGTPGSETVVTLERGSDVCDEFDIRLEKKKPQEAAEHSAVEELEIVTHEMMQLSLADERSENAGDSDRIEELE